MTISWIICNCTLKGLHKAFCGTTEKCENKNLMHEAGRIKCSYRVILVDNRNCSRSELKTSSESSHRKKRLLQSYNITDKAQPIRNRAKKKNEMTEFVSVVFKVLKRIQILLIFTLRFIYFCNLLNFKIQST